MPFDSLSRSAAADEHARAAPASMTVRAFAPGDFQRPDDVFAAVAEAYQVVRQGGRAVLVVPPITDDAGARELERRWREESDGQHGAAPADSPAARAAALTAMACDKVGLDVALLPASQTAVDDAAVRALADAHEVVVLSAGTAENTTDAQPEEAPRPTRVALAGFGVVGAGVAARVAREPQRFELVSVLVRDRNKPRTEPLPPDLATTDLDAFLAAGADIVVDVLSSGEAGHALIQRALAAGVSVVSANKQAVVSDIAALHRLGRGYNARLAYSAAVGGGCPMTETVRRARAAGERIQRVDAVLNGTVNFVLEQMAGGASFDAAMADARTAGFAEEDPSADLDGHDAAAKIRILAFEAFGEVPADADVPRDALNADACARIAADGGMWKQIGRAWRENDRVRAQVRLVPAGDDALFAATRGEGNAIRVTGADGRAYVARGRGAGRYPTTEAVMADLADVRAVIAGL